MSILFFTKGDRKTASSRYRVWNVAAKLLREYNVEYNVLHSLAYPYWEISVARFRIIKKCFVSIKLKEHKVLFVHKSLFPWDIIILVLWGKELLRKKLVYDLDDAEWIHSPVKSILLARRADIVLCGSHVILDWAKQYNDNSVLIPTAVDVYGSYAVSYNKDQKITIGWVGNGKAHFKSGNFLIMRNVLRNLTRHSLPFRFVIIGSQEYTPLKDFFSQETYEVLFIDELSWEDDMSVPRAIAINMFNIGVMPLRDTAFTRAKCALKAIEYMACGVPVVSSAVGEANYLIQNGVNGFLAKNEKEWTNVLTELLCNNHLRKRIGLAGKESVSKNYSYSYIIPLIYKAIKNIERYSINK